MYKITQRKKAQSALEFLTTYGWAFLVILIMIGALAYFGVLDPGRFLPDRCQFQSEIGCQESVIAGENPQVQLRLINNVGSRVTVHSVNVTNQDGNQQCTGGTIGGGTNPNLDDAGDILGTPASIDWNANAQIDIAMTGCSVTPGDRPTFDVTLVYNQAGSTFNRTTTGVVSGRAN